MSVAGVLHIVSDLETAVSFYTQILDFQETGRITWSEEVIEPLFLLPKTQGKLSLLRLGHEWIYLLEFSPGSRAPTPVNSQSNDLWFQHIAIVVSDMKRAHAKLMQYGVQSISAGYQTIPQSNKAAGGIQAFYFRSPDGHPQELIFFPPGKGKPCWQSPSALFLGIDHTAIAVSNTESSLQLYRDLLGMRVVGESLNDGLEQERLSGVAGAKVKITMLQFPSTPGVGIEFLEYLHPKTGRAKPKTAQPHHLTEMATVIAVEDLAVLEQGLRAQDKCLSLHAVPIKGLANHPKAVLGRDPDGHPLLFLESG